jgi:two-component system, chemotaxis family, chemotaxis protein CheY
MQQRVLIVDDSILMRRIIGRVLESDGWEVAGEAGNGREAAEKYQELWPDAVTLDVTMPECSGLMAVKTILDIDPQAKVVVVSAVSQARLIAEAIRAGAHDFIAKPFAPEQLQEAMRACVNKDKDGEALT